MFGALTASARGPTILLDASDTEDEAELLLPPPQDGGQAADGQAAGAGIAFAAAHPPAAALLWWPCHACTFRNTNLHGLACEVCATPRRRPAAAPAAPAAAADEEVRGGPAAKRRRRGEGDAGEPPTQCQEPGKPTPAPNAFDLLLRQRVPPPSAPSSRAPPDNGAIPRCSVGDTAGIQRALREVGAVILKHVVGSAEIAHAEELFFQWLESLPLGIRRNKPRTFRSEAWRNLGYSNTGVIANYSIGQSAFMWYLRLNPSVRRAFAAIWGLPLAGCTEHGSGDADIPPLITSFDGCGAQRNIFLQESERDWRTAGRWFHLDQNSRIAPGLHTYQGVLNLYPTDAVSGSTVLVPGSHHRFAEICAAHPEARGSFVKLAEQRSPGRELVAAAVQAVLDPGDLLVWDSRVVHCNQGPCPQRCKSPEDTAALRGGRAAAPLSRLVAYVAMLPASRLSPSLAAARKACVQEGRSTGHDASYVPRGGKRVHKHPDFRPPSPSDPLWRLVAPGF